MSSVTAVSSQASLGRRGLFRLTLAAVAAIGLAAPTAAQTTPKRWDLLIPTGKVIPTGAQRDAIKSANLTAIQVSYLVAPAVAVTGTVGWARSRDVASIDQPKLDVFTYDLGAELRTPRWGESITAHSFVGVGGGARSYNYRNLPVDATHNVAAYGSAGGEVGWGRLGLRVEARDYVTGFKPLDGRGGSDARNDVMVLVGLRIDWR